MIGGSGLKGGSLLPAFVPWRDYGAATEKPTLGGGLFSWWRRGELNPRPHKSHISFYARVPSLVLVHTAANGQATV